MNVVDYIFETKEAANTALEKADKHWKDQIYTGGYFPEGEIYRVIIIDNVIYSNENGEWYTVCNEYGDYYVNKNNNQWEHIS